jgi:hypothetical protein
MKEQFVTYEIALALKELGFDEEVLATYDTDEINDSKHELKIFAFAVPDKGIFEQGFKKGWCIRAPLWQQAIDYLREIHNCHIYIRPEPYTTGINYNWQLLFYNPEDRTCWDKRSTGMYGDNGEYSIYEEALEEALLHALKLIKI